jgi:hypothetical protein
MPVILTTPDEVEAWMTAPAEQALKLQRPLANGSLRIVARGVKEDSAEPAAPRGVGFGPDFIDLTGRDLPVDVRDSGDRMSAIEMGARWTPRATDNAVT